MDNEFIRIESFTAISSPPETDMQLYQELKALAASLRKNKGCKGAQAMMSTQNESLFVLIEIWEDSDARRTINPLSEMSSDVTKDRLAAPSTVRTFTT